MKSIFLGSEQNIKNVYGEQRINHIASVCGGDGILYTKKQVLESPEAFAKTEFVFSTWGMPTFTEDEIKTCLPSLKAVFYAAGTVQSFARPFLHCGVKVFSAWAANAVPVAEYTLAQILLANTGFFPKSRLMSKGDVAGARNFAAAFPGNYEVTVGIIGAGMIGKKVIELLRPFNIKTVVFDPFLSDEKAEELGTRKLSLEELFESCDVVSNHLANNAQTVGMLNYALFSKMKKGAAFINTGRGAQVVEEDLVRLLGERPDVYALLDVTHPEPPKADHPFYSLENCILTPHIAGSKGNELRRMSAYMLEEYERLTAGVPCLYEVSEKMLETMA